MVWGTYKNIKVVINGRILRIFIWIIIYECLLYMQIDEDTIEDLGDQKRA